MLTRAFFATAAAHATGAVIIRSDVAGVVDDAAALVGDAPVAADALGRLLAIPTERRDLRARNGAPCIRRRSGRRPGPRRGAASAPSWRRPPRERASRARFRRAEGGLLVARSRMPSWRPCRVPWVAALV